MKMKEVCAATGLTERAVRLYCSEGLIEPIRTELRNRVYLEFSDDHITTLSRIADLRGAGFSLEEIKTVLNEPHLIPSLLVHYRARLEAEQGTQAKFLSALAEADEGLPPTDAASLCALLYPPEKPREYINAAVLHDCGPSYREFVERGTPVQVELNYKSYRRIKRRIILGRLGMIFFGIVYWMEALLLLIGMMDEDMLGFGLILFAIEAVIWVFLMRGVLWLRVLVAVNLFFAVISASRSMTRIWPHLVTYHSYAADGTTAEWTQLQGSWLGVGVYGALMVIFALCFYLITFNHSVREYLYDRSTRY